MEFEIATLKDLKEICFFTDFWLAGRGLKKHAPGAVNDCFISPSQHTKYILRYKTYVIFRKDKIIAWAVIQLDGSLIHLLVSGYHRHEGIGSWIIQRLQPKIVHSKNDQSSGDPAEFYEKLGYTKTATVKSASRLDINKIRPDRKKNIDIYQLV